MDILVPLLFIYAVYKILCFILSDSDFEVKSKISSLNCLSCFIHISNCKISLYLYFHKFFAGRGFIL